MDSQMPAGPRSPCFLVSDRYDPFHTKVIDSQVLCLHLCSLALMIGICFILIEFEPCVFSVIVLGEASRGQHINSTPDLRG